MAQRESRLSKEIQRAVRGVGYFCFKVHGGPTMMSGLPDIVVCAEGYFIGLETKHPETRDDLSPRQRIVQHEIERGGGTYAVVTTPDEALEVIARVIARGRQTA